MMFDVFQMIAGLIAVSAFLPYMREIIRGIAVPMKATWIIWATLDTLVLEGMIAEGVPNGQIIAFAVCGWVIVFLSFKYGIPGWTTLDKVCLVIGVLGIIGRLYYSANLAILCGLTGGVVAASPTIVSAWTNPKNESGAGWALWLISSIVTLTVLPAWSFSGAAQVITYGCVQVVMVFLIYLKPRLIRVAA